MSHIAVVSTSLPSELLLMHPSVVSCALDCGGVKEKLYLLIHVDISLHAAPRGMKVPR